MTARQRLAISGLRKEFGDFALSDVDITVGSDQIVALLGPSGCGKTSVLRCVAGVETPDAGRIHIGGDLVYDETTARPPEDRDAGMVYQDYAIWPHKTVYENVVFPLKYANTGVPADRRRERVETVLELVEIADLIDAPATDLSGGQQQRTALARALVHDPALLLLDEPLSNLDRELRRTMRYELQRLQHELDIALLYVTHDQEEAFYLADRVLVMRDGKIVERGEPRQLYRQPKTAFTRRFVGVRNRFPGTVRIDGDGEAVVGCGIVDFALADAGYVADGVGPGEVVCFLGPEDIANGRFGPGGDGILQLSGTVVAEGLLGDRYEVVVECADGETELVVHIDTDQQFEPGNEIHLHLPPRSIQVYAPDDE